MMGVTISLVRTVRSPRLTEEETRERERQASQQAGIETARHQDGTEQTYASDQCSRAIECIALLIRGGIEKAIRFSILNNMRPL